MTISRSNVTLAKRLSPMWIGLVARVYKFNTATEKDAIEPRKCRCFAMMGRLPDEGCLCWLCGSDDGT